MTKILCLTGKKQSGKNTSFNFLLGLEMLKLGVVHNRIEITEEGKLFISDLSGNTDYEGLYDIDRPTKAVQMLNEQFIYPFIRNYSFADRLKRDVCMGLLDLPYESCYGTDEQKDKSTHLHWTDMPGVMDAAVFNKMYKDVENAPSREQFKEFTGVTVKPNRFMSGREVMQYIGTEVFRKMGNDIWARKTVEQILQDKPKLAVITDCRFPDEVAAVQKAGGKVVRLTRFVKGDQDEHASEKSLDAYQYDWDNFDAIIDNREMSISEQNETLYKLLDSWGWVDQLTTPEK